MTSIVPSFVFSGIEVIARAGNSLPERRARAAQRISQFEADLAASGRPAPIPAAQLSEMRRGVGSFDFFSVRVSTPSLSSAVILS
jgi:hypothetical protein